MMRSSTSSILALVRLAGLGNRGHAQRAEPTVPLCDNLGDYHCAVTTDVPLA